MVVRTAEGFLDGLEHLEELKEIDEQLQRLCRETDIGEAQGKLLSHTLTGDADYYDSPGRASG